MAEERMTGVAALPQCVARALMNCHFSLSRIAILDSPTSRRLSRPWL